MRPSDQDISVHFNFLVTMSKLFEKGMVIPSSRGGSALRGSSMFLWIDINKLMDGIKCEF